MTTAFSIKEYEYCRADDCKPRVGRYVRPDGWSYGSCLEPSEWEEANFRLPMHSNGPITSLAVNVTVSGRTVQRDNGCNAVRVRVEFVGDCEPSTTVGGWMHVTD